MERKTLEKAWLDSYDIEKGTPEEKVTVLASIPSKTLAEETYEAAMELRDEGINWYGSDFEEELVEITNRGDLAITNPDVHISVEEYNEITEAKKQ